MMSTRTWNLLASTSLLGLIVLGCLWEGVLAPVRPGGSWMILKVVPLLPAVFGILRGRRYTHQWCSLLAMLYLTEGIVRMNDAGLSGRLAMVEIALSLLFFVGTMMYARNTAPSRNKAS